MASNISVKVVGFSETERHSMNTLFRLSEGSDLTYVLWTPDAPCAPDVVLVDVDSRDADLENAALMANTEHKLICVGSKPLESAWRSFNRPVDWSALMGVLDAVFVSEGGGSVDVELHEPMQSGFALDDKACLVVGFSSENGLYLRARLALAGMCDVDEVESVTNALMMVKQRHHGVVIANVDMNDMGIWGFVQTMADWSAPHRSVIVATTTRSRRTVEMAEQFGCTGILDVPFAPQQVLALLQKVATLTSVLH